MSAVEQEQNERCNIIDGKAIAKSIRAEIKRDIQAIRDRVVPGLATVIVGDRTDSATYIRMKIKACQECLIESFHRALPANASEQEVLQTVEELNADDRVHGILVQLPLPQHINEERVLSAISVEKDVDGFHPVNIGRLAMRNRKPLFVPCTPAGCIELLKRSDIEMAGKEAVVIGRSNIVGLPVALLLIQENATVTITHSHTKNLSSVVKRADIVIAAVGKTEIVKSSWLKPGCTVIDVGMNSKPDSSKKSGQRLVGDCDFEDCRQVAGFITPVPGGVGPMTIAMLLRNCLDAASRTLKDDRSS